MNWRAINYNQFFFEVTHRCFQWPTPAADTLIKQNQGGRVLEMLSEHTLQGWLQGYLLTGRHGVFPTYEAFTGIIATMMDQYSKFLKTAREVRWRHDVPSLNYIESSTLWRQEHNGFSHQNPGFINTLLNKKCDILRVYLPPDANCMVSTIDHCLRSKNYVNLIVAGKQPMAQFLTMPEALAHCRAGASVWKWASTDNGVRPDVTLVGIGTETTIEVVAAASILRKEVPQLRVRVVNVTDLMVLDQSNNHPHALKPDIFHSLFTKDKPIVINFHGYPSAVRQLLFSQNVDAGRVFINGYTEEGTTTTPFEMLVYNKCSRYHLIMQAIRYAAASNENIAPIAAELIANYEYKLREHENYIKENGDDPKEITDFKFQW